MVQYSYKIRCFGLESEVVKAAPGIQHSVGTVINLITIVQTVAVFTQNAKAMRNSSKYLADFPRILGLERKLSRWYFRTAFKGGSSHA